MKMTIDEAIAVLGMVESYGLADYAKNIAIDTMRKYKKLNEIVSLNDKEFKEYSIKELAEILEEISKWT